MKKLIRVAVTPAVLKKFDADVKNGRRADKMATVLAPHVKDLKARSKKKNPRTEIISVLVDSDLIETVKDVAYVEQSSITKILGDIVESALK
jgi:hypothetical protein